MNVDALDDALRLAEGRPVFVATADADGLPHVACAGRLAAGPQGRLLVTEWFCPGTLDNLACNPRIALAVWDEAADAGYQLVGQVERVEDMAVLDGYGEPGGGPQVPQVQRRLVVRVEAAMDFRKAPHTDAAL
jgi:predicted pyridoxine 5'-phosphate oxidase superfamily flavin-nucleotide-binding protein